MKTLLIVAKNEFSLVARNPVVVLFMGIMFIMAVLNALGASGFLSNGVVITDYAGAILSEFQNIISSTSGLFLLLTICLGIVSFADERSKGVLYVMLSKPLYRRDLVIGKFAGIATFILLMITVTLVLFTTFLVSVYNNTGSVLELTVRMALLIFLLFMYCCFTLGLITLFSLRFSKGAALIASLAYFSYDAYGGSISITDPWLGILRQLDPNQLFYDTLLGMNGSGLLDTTISLGAWLNYSWPYIVLLVIFVTAIILIDIVVFNREET